MTQAPNRLPLARRRAAFGVIFDQYALRLQHCRFIRDPEAREQRQRELVEQIVRLESIVQVIGGVA